MFHIPFEGKTAEQIMAELFSEAQEEAAASAHQGIPATTLSSTYALSSDMQPNATSDPMDDDEIQVAQPSSPIPLYSKKSPPPSIKKYLDGANPIIDKSRLRPSDSLAAVAAAVGFTAATTRLERVTHKIARDPARKQAAFLEEVVKNGIRETPDGAIYRYRANNMIARVEVDFGKDGKIIGGKAHALVYSGFNHDFKASASDKRKLENCIKELALEHQSTSIERARCERVWRYAVMCAQRENGGHAGPSTGAHSSQSYETSKNYFINIVSTYFIGKTFGDVLGAGELASVRGQAEAYFQHCLNRVKNDPIFQQDGAVPPGHFMNGNDLFHRNIGVATTLTNGERALAQRQATQVWDDAKKYAKNVVKEAGKQALSSLSLEERIASYLWTRIIHAPLNRALAAGDCEKAEKLRPLVHCLVSGLNKLRDLYPTQSKAAALYRGMEGMTDEQREAFKERHAAGSYVLDPRFLATSAKKEVAHLAFGSSAEITINGPRSASYVAPISRAPSHEETVFLPGCMFYIQASKEIMKDGKPALEMVWREVTKEEYDKWIRARSEDGEIVPSLV
jgi:hypothetical protein